MPRGNRQVLFHLLRPSYAKCYNPRSGTGSHFPQPGAGVFLMTLRRWFSFGILFLAVSASLFGQTAPAKHPTRKKTKAKAAPVAPLAPAIVPPGVSPVPLTLAQRPAIAPRVQYQNGILTIVAENSTLGDILRAVHQQSGAIVDLPPNATERVVANLGPGPSRDVLAALLNGSNFNYVMLGSEKDPNDVQHVIVTSKSGGESGEVANNNAPQPGFNGRTPMAPTNNGPVVTGGAADSGGDSDAGADDSSASDDQPQADDQAQEGPNEPHESPSNGPGIKTPEQLLQELQRQQQMQQQQQQPPQSAPQGFPPPPQNPEPQE